MPIQLARALRTTAFVAALLGLPRMAQAIPVFANGQGISCETCHTVYPAMTRYGMMVMMSNFQVLNWHLQRQALPTSVRVLVQSYLANQSTPGQTQVSDLSLLTGGFAGKNLTFYNEQHVIDGGQIGDTDQLWLSWNGLLHGVNSLQVGKFHTPFPFMPAHAWSLGSYLLATQTTGQNTFNPNDARWGVAFNGMSNEFMYNASYLTGSGPLQSALDYNPADAQRALDLNVSYGGMEVPWTLGVVGIRGFAPLYSARPVAPASAGPVGTFAGSDAFTREGVYYAYQVPKWHLQTMYYHGYDARPDLDEFGVSLNGFMIELQRDFGWRNHVLVRYDVASSDTLNRQYVLDVDHSLAPNIKLVGEVLAGPGMQPQYRVLLGYAGPWLRGRRYLYDGPHGIRVASPNATTSKGS
ncbi:hypothetical protein EPN52_10780 [bacterium]|nr:MAG: hypothetical protein EPN52_10780 [bacterium]